MNDGRYSYYTLRLALYAAKVCPHDDCTGIIITIPRGSTVVLDEYSCVAGMARISWREETYEIFRDDLVCRADRMASGPFA